MTATINRPPTARELLGSQRWWVIYQEPTMKLNEKAFRAFLCQLRLSTLTAIKADLARCPVPENYSDIADVVQESLTRHAPVEASVK